jgi:prevent-host-death family protein
MTDTWKVQDAKARFSEMLDATHARGPQIVTRRGVEEAVLVPIEQWRSMDSRKPIGVKEWLLGPGPRTDDLVPPRKKYRRRKPIKL